MASMLPLILLRRRPSSTTNILKRKFLHTTSKNLSLAQCFPSKSEMELREEKFNSLLDAVMHGQFSPTPPADTCENSGPPEPSHHLQEETSLYSYTSPDIKREDGNIQRRKYETGRLDTVDMDTKEKFFEFVEQKSQQSSSLGYSLSFSDCHSSINPIRQFANLVQQDQLNYVERRRMDDHMLMPRTYEEALAPSGQARVITEATGPFRITHVNGAWTDLCGYTLEEVRGQTLEIIQGRDTDPTELLLLESAIRARAEAETVLVNYVKDGRPFINRIRISPLKDKETGRVTHLIGVLKDVLQEETPIQMNI